MVTRDSDSTPQIQSTPRRDGLPMRRSIRGRTGPPRGSGTGRRTACRGCCLAGRPRRSSNLSGRPHSQGHTGWTPNSSAASPGPSHERHCGHVHRPAGWDRRVGGLGMAGGLARRSASAGAKAAIVGCVVGSIAGLSISLLVLPNFYKAHDPQSHDLMLPLLTLGSICSSVGAAGAWPSGSVLAGVVAGWKSFAGRLW